MVYNLITLPVTIVFVANGFCQLYYALKLKKLHSSEHNLLNSTIIVVLWIIAGLLYPLFYVTDNENIRWFQSLSTFFICVFTPGLIFLILYYQHKIVIQRKNPDIKRIRNFEVFLKNLMEKDQNNLNSRKSTLKTDVHRKLLHFFPAGVIIILWIFAVHIWEDLWNANEFWGIGGEEFGRFLILTVGYSGILVFAALDYLRLSHIFKRRSGFHLIPTNVLNLLKKSMKSKEAFEFVKPAALVLAFVPIFFFPFSLFVAAALIATIGDGAASIFGLSFGRVKFPKKGNKMIIGYLAGFISSFGISFFSIFFFEPTLSLEKITIISLSGAIIFFIIDFVSLNIDDNILNPILCCFVMAILYYLL